MFLRMLNDDQKRALLILAYHLVVSDNSVSDGESELLDELANGLRTDIPVTPQQLLERPSLKIFDTRQSRVALMLELLTLSYGDNQVPSAESVMIQKLARDLGFSDIETEKMKKWGESSCRLLNDALTLIENK